MAARVAADTRSTRSLPAALAAGMCPPAPPRAHAKPTFALPRAPARSAPPPRVEVPPGSSSQVQAPAESPLAPPRAHARDELPPVRSTPPRAHAGVELPRVRSTPPRAHAGVELPPVRSTPPRAQPSPAPEPPRAPPAPASPRPRPRRDTVLSRPRIASAARMALAAATPTRPGTTPGGILEPARTWPSPRTHSPAPDPPAPRPAPAPPRPRPRWVGTARGGARITG